MKTCENCGSRVYSLGCVNCDEENYIEQQRAENDRIEAEQRREREADKKAKGGT